MSDSSPWPEPPAGYLDATGGVPLLPAVQAAIRTAWSQGFADPGRLHHAGRQSAVLLQAARAAVAAVIAVRPDEVFFASSFPELLRALMASLDRHGDAAGAVIATTPIETRAQLDVIGSRPNRIIDVDTLGRIDIATLQRSAPPVLAVVQGANVEIGTLQPLDEVAAAIPATPILSDLTGLIGRLPVPGGWTHAVARLHDIGAPAGIALAVVRRGQRGIPDSHHGWVGGAPDVASAIGAATALEVLAPVAEAESARLHVLTAYLRGRITSEVTDVVFAGDPTSRLPHVLSASVASVDGEALVSDLDRLGFGVASGSACAPYGEPSHVLDALGAPAGANVRISLPFGTTERTVDNVADAFVQSAHTLRARYLS